MAQKIIGGNATPNLATAVYANAVAGDTIIINSAHTLNINTNTTLSINLNAALGSIDGSIATGAGMLIKVTTPKPKNSPWTPGNCDDEGYKDFDGKDDDSSMGGCSLAVGQTGVNYDYGIECC